MLTLKPLSVDWSVAGAEIPAVTFIAQAGLITRELAHMLDSLVRVSRRAEWHHLVSQTNPMAGAIAGVHFPAGKLACPQSSACQRAAADIQGQKHRATQDRAGQPRLRCDRPASPGHTTIWPRCTGTIRFPFSNFRHF